jgi:general secretion pathway protein D
VQYSLSRMLGDVRINGQLNNGQGKTPTAELPGFALSIDSPVKVIIDALSAITSINVVSSPHLMVLNNQTARLQVGDQIPVATQNAQKTLDNPDVTVNTIAFRDTGVIFEVTPRINSAGSVTLLINQEVSSAQKSAQSTLTPTISQRKLNSSITVDDGESIILGGLFSTETQRGSAGIPELSQVPVLGDLFGRKSETIAKTELLVLISPRIVSNNIDARAVTREMTQRMDALRLEEATYVSENTGARIIVPADRVPVPGCRSVDCPVDAWDVSTADGDVTGSTTKPSKQKRQK